MYVYIEKITMNNLLMKKIFTQEEVQPSEAVLELIRQVAYTYRPLRLEGGVVIPYCLN